MSLKLNKCEVFLFCSHYAYKNLCLEKVEECKAFCLCVWRKSRLNYSSMVGRVRILLRLTRCLNGVQASTISGQSLAPPAAYKEHWPCGMCCALLFIYWWSAVCLVRLRGDTMLLLTWPHKKWNDKKNPNSCCKSTRPASMVDLASGKWMQALFIWWLSGELEKPWCNFVWNLC